MDSEHKVTLTVSETWGVEWSFTCGYDMDDEARPCWPHTEDGERASAEYAALSGCTYQSWWDNEGTEMIHTGPTLSFPLTATWEDGDYFRFHLAAPTVEENDEQ